MTPTTEARAVFENERDRVCAIAVARWGAGAVAGLTYAWDIRGTSMLGAALPLAGHIRFNAAVANASPEAFGQTVAHEIAHVVARRVFGASGHGPQWAAVMRAFGRPADRCSNNQAALALAQDARIKRGGARAACECAEHALTKGMVERLTLGTASFRCRKCNGPLRLIR